MSAWPVLPYLLAAAVVGVGLFLHDGWQRVREERRHPIRATERMTARAKQVNERRLG